MIPEYQEKINVRISTEDSQCLKQLIQEGKFKDQSSAIRQALGGFLGQVALEMAAPKQVAEAVVLSKGEIKASNTGEKPCQTASI